jgi:uncharacterized lipoprotein YbaY
MTLRIPIMLLFVSTVAACSEKKPQQASPNVQAEAADLTIPQDAFSVTLLCPLTRARIDIVVPGGC